MLWLTKSKFLSFSSPSPRPRLSPPTGAVGLGVLHSAMGFPGDFFRFKASNMIKRNFLIVLLLFLASLPGEMIHAQELEKVYIQFKWLHQFQFAGYYAAKAQGFYADEGLDVALLQHNTDVDPVEEVVNDRAQYGIADSGLLLSRLGGKPVVLVAQIFQHSPVVIVTLKKSGLRTPYDLEGKSIMTYLRGHLDADLRVMVLKALGSQDKVQWKEHTYQNQDLIEGRVDGLLAYSTNEPFWFHEQGEAINIIDPRDFGINFYGDNLFTSEVEVQNHPGRVYKIHRATVKGWKYALDHPQEMVDLILAQYNPQKLTRAHLEYEARAIADLINAKQIEIGHYESSRFHKIADTYQRLGLTDQQEIPAGFLWGEVRTDGDAIKKVARLHEVAQEMKYLDEVLTTSVLAYAFTHDKKWLNRYNEHEPKLGKIFDEAISHKQRKDAVVVERINSANDQLVAMEIGAIDLVGKGKRQQALNILNSSNYYEQKKQFAQALKVYFLTLEESFNKGLISTDAPVQAKAKLTAKEQRWVETHTVKVGIEEWPPIVFATDDGGVGGLTGGVLELLTQRTGLKFEIVSDAWDPLLKGLHERTIGLLPATYHTDERASYGLYSKPYFLMKEFVYVQTENQEVRSLDDLADKKIAVVKGYGTIPKLKEHLPEAEIVETPDLLASINAVLNGDVDALVEAQMAVQSSLQTNGIVGLKGISQTVFPSSPIHLFSRIDKPLLQSILQKGLDTISVEESRALQNKWLGLDGGGDSKRVELTLDEEQWLSKHANIHMGDDFAWPPFSFRDERGNFSGIAAGYMEVISDRLDMEIKPIWGLTWTQTLKQVKSGGVDLLPAVARTPEREKFLNFTKPYISFPVVIATRKDGPFVDNLSDLKGLKVGVVAGYITEELLTKEHPGLTLVLSKNLEEGMEALQDGKIDAFVDNLGSITHLIDKKGLKRVKIAAPTEYRFDLSIGVRKDWPELVAILDKALDSIDDKERAAIKNSWMAIQVQFGLKMKTVLMWVVPGIAGAGLIIFLISTWNRRMSQEITQRKKVEGELREAMEVISGSIQYASRIQRSVLPPSELLDNLVREYFVLWKPRDVVGGDIYWCREWGQGTLVILADCTGHGVPGAFMTLISSGSLDMSILDVPVGDPAALIRRMHQLIQIVLGQDSDTGQSDDGLELGMCYIHPHRDQITFAGAGFPLFKLNKEKIDVIKGNKTGIGYRYIAFDSTWINRDVEVSDGDIFYMSSDGIFDQIGGPKRMGFGKKRFRKLLASIQEIPITGQGEKIYQEFEKYQGKEKRRDDVSAIGFKL